MNMAYRVAPDVLLVDCHFRPAAASDHYYVTEHTEPLGLEYLEAFLEQHGYSCDIVRSPESALPLYYEDAPRVVGISGLTYSWNEMQSMARKARQLYPEALIIAGREHASAIPERVLQDPVFDAVVIGEGELPLLALVQGRPLQSVPSIAFRTSQGETMRTAPGRPLNPQEWASPKRHSAWMRNMFQETSTRHLEQAGIMLGRGCIFRCEFCTAPMMWGKFRHTNATPLVDEIQTIRTQYGIRYYAFHDLMVNAHPPTLHDFLIETMRRGLDVEFFGMASATKAKLDFHLLKRGGMHELGIGVEVPSDQRKDIGKGLGLLPAIDFTGAARDAGIFIRCYLIIGWPWETDEMAVAEQYLRFLSICPVNSVRIHFLTPFPGTSDWERYRANLRWTHPEDHFHRFTTMEPVLHFQLSQPSLVAVRHRILEGYYNSQAYDGLRRQQRSDPVLDEMNAAVWEWAISSGYIRIGARSAPSGVCTPQHPMASHTKAAR